MSTYYSAQDDISFTPLTREQEKQLFSRYYASPAESPTADSLAARDEIIKCHLKLAAKLSLLYAKGGLREDDAISAGNFGLIQALECRCFDASRGTLFSSYVRAYIRGQILQALRERGWRGDAANPSELEYAPESTITGADGGEEQITRRGHAVTVIQSQIIKNRALIDTVDASFENQQLSSVRREVIEEALAELPELEASTIRDHFFLDKNFADIGRERKLTREGVRKAFNRGMAKLKKLLANRTEDLN